MITLERAPFIISGKIWEGEHGENYETLFIGYSSEPFSQRMKGICAGKFVTVKYWIDERELDLEDLKEETMKSICGAADCKYCHTYSELTGYLWTEDGTKVGGHDLLAELISNVGKYLYMEIKLGKK